MKNLLITLVLLLLALAGIVIRKTYFAVPVRELKRRAAKHQQPAVQLYRAVAYGRSLRILLWLYIGLTSAVLVVWLARWLPVWISLLIVGPLLWITFSWLPTTRTTKTGIYLSKLVTPPIAWLLNYLHPTLSRSAAVLEGHQLAHTGLFERDDVLALLKRQKSQTDNRLSDEELGIIKRVLEFDDHHVGDIMTPRSDVKTVLSDATVGPILIDELHQSGQDFALVRRTQRGDFVGSLAFGQLNLDTQGKVRDAMDGHVYYLHEADTLSQALHAFFTTNHPLFIVVNSAEEFVGVLTVTTVLKQMLGHVPGEDFDQYTDLTAVAARHRTVPKAEDQETPVKTDDEVVE